MQQIVRFRRHVVVHLPRKDEILGGIDGVKVEELLRMWTTIGHMLWQEGRWNEAEELVVKMKGVS
jgi:hypothetical protein